MLEAEKRFYRVQGYRDIPALQAALRSWSQGGDWIAGGSRVVCRAVSGGPTQDPRRPGHPPPRPQEECRENVKSRGRP